MGDSGHANINIYFLKDWRRLAGRAAMRAPAARRGAEGSPQAVAWGSGRSPV